MKKALFIFFVLLISGISVYAQNAPVAANDKPNSPVILFEETLFNYGTIVQDGNGMHNFIYKNTGKEPLVLSRVRSSCGCTIPEWSRQPLMSMEQDTIKVKYDTHRIGRFSKTISVYSNAKDPMVVVRIQGEVVAKPVVVTEDK
ncbi:MAG: DUF1573 domain-containing protein [Bacteroidales bacterium]|jgi:hypothetical protein|nr:DUF1573 domain-containing protein [Bacteroidales bacterium]